MKTKRLMIVLATLLVLGLLVSACGPAEETTTTVEEPTEKAVIEEGEAEEPAADAEEGEGAAPAAEGGWCADTKIVFFPGGSPGGPFATVVYNGAVAAAVDTGADVEYMWSDWNPEKMITQFTEAVAIKPDGIAVMGHPGDDAFAPLVDDAEAQGIVVTSMNTQLASLQAKYGSAGFGYVGAILYDAGYALGQESVTRFDLQAGDQAFVWGLLGQAGRGERTQGVIDAVEDAGLEVVYLEIDDATNADAAAGVPQFVGVISANPDIKLVVTDHGALTATLETYLTSADLGPDDVFAVGFDLSSGTVAAIKGGWTDLVIDQQQWLQGYLSVLQLCLTDNYAFTGLHIDTGAGFAHADNVDLLEALVGEQIR